MKHQWQWMKKRMRQVVAPWWWNFCHVFVNIFPISGPHDTHVHPKAFFRSLYSWDQAGGQRTIWVQATHLKSPILRSDGKLLLFFKITRVCYPLNHKGKDIALMCFFCCFFEKVLQISRDQFWMLLHVKKYKLCLFPFVSPAQFSVTSVFTCNAFQIWTSSQ